MEEPFAPLGDDLPRQVEVVGNVLIPHPFGGTQNGLCPRHIAIR